MTLHALSLRPAATLRRPGLDADAVTLLQEILDDPSLPVGTTAVGVDGARTAVLREALDHLVTVRAAATLGDPDAGPALLTTLGEVDADLAHLLTAHVDLAGVLPQLPAGRARNALIGDVGRGDLLTWGVSTGTWTWRDGHAPDDETPVSRADAELQVQGSPELFATVLTWDPGTRALVAVPTHRERVTWTPEDGAGAARGTWRVRLTQVTFHRDELVPLDDTYDGASPWARVARP